MNVIKDEIRAAVEKELTAANERFPLFASLHEAYAVIKEEIEEASDELAEVNHRFNWAWEQIKQNSPVFAQTFLVDAGCAAEKLAIEACQIAAMCKKAVMSAEHQVNVKELEDKHWSECAQISRYDQELKEALHWLNYYAQGIIKND